MPKRTGGKKEAREAGERGMVRKQKTTEMCGSVVTNWLAVLLRAEQEVRNTHLFVQTRSHTCGEGQGICAGDLCESGWRDDEQTDKRGRQRGIGLERGRSDLDVQPVNVASSQTEMSKYITCQSNTHIHAHGVIVEGQAEAHKIRLSLLIKYYFFPLVHLCAVQLGHLIISPSTHTARQKHTLKYTETPWWLTLKLCTLLVYSTRSFGNTINSLISCGADCVPAVNLGSSCMKNLLFYTSQTYPFHCPCCVLCNTAEHPYICFT